MIEQYINQVICADCLPILRDLPDDCVKLVFADPPYNFGVPYKSYDDNQDPVYYEEWCKSWFIECRRIAQRVIITPGHGNLWMWGRIEKPWGVGCWYKPGNPASSVLGWCCWEPWLYWCKDYKYLGGPDVIRATVTNQQDTGEHPCPKSLNLLLQLVEKATKPGDLVLDPFMGSGTTPVAAKRLGRRWIGIEMEMDYVKTAELRLKALDYVVDLFQGE